MLLRTLVGALAVAVWAGTAGAAPAGASCCDHHAMTSGDTACACCGKQEAAHQIPTMDPNVTWSPLPQTEPPARPVRETMTVRFMNPVKVADSILQGTYIIEHDTERMARGEPCTFIYEVDRLDEPVVTFHCTHLERDPGAHPTVTVRTIPGELSGMKELVEFQFLGEQAGHGVPGVR